MLAVVIVSASLLGIGAWLRHRHRQTPVFALRRHSSAKSESLPAPVRSAPETSAADALEGARIETANGAATERLWRLAFAMPSQGAFDEAAQRRVRDNILAMLQVDTLDPAYFPRRPALMPQLLQAIDDPRAASERLSRIIAHDPVIAADVLRLANSSLYRTSPAPIETIQRAIVVCGVDALRGMLAAAVLRPVFRATSKNFPRFPRVLWDRTERAARAAELYAMATRPEDRFEAQLVVLLSALGPLVVYSAVLDVYSRNPHFAPSAALCVELIRTLAPQLSQRMARDWQTSPRLVAALGKSSGETLGVTLQVGEFLGTLAFLEAQTVISHDDRCGLIDDAGLSGESVDRIWMALTGNA